MISVRGSVSEPKPEPRPEQRCHSDRHGHGDRGRVVGARRSDSDSEPGRRPGLRLDLNLKGHESLHRI